MTLRWEDRLSVGHAIIDRQHQTIIRLINQLKLEANDEYLPSIGSYTLKTILLYADNHLAFEENIIAKAGFPELAEHKEIHNYYRAAIKGLLKKVDDGDASIKEDIIAFFSEWWEKHIREDDMMFKPYMEEMA